MISIITDLHREYGDFKSGETLIFNDVTSIRPTKFTRPNFWLFFLRATADMEVFGGEGDIARKKFMENRILCAWSILRRVNKKYKYR